MPPIVLAILDGWGEAPAGPANAITLARKPVYDRLWRECPHTQLATSGPAVGLPDGQMGNSEVGHLNIGAGRAVLMDVTRMDQAIASHELNRNPALLAALRQARGSQLHFLGLVSDGGVHSQLHHLEALLRIAREQGVEKILVHAFTDGRDTMPHSGRDYLGRLQQALSALGAGRIATISGRYYAMDRDRRWERIQLATDALAHGGGARAANAVAALTASYERGTTDEFVIPTVLAEPGQPADVIRDGDVCINFNFRADRARQITRALTRAGEPDTALEQAIPAATMPSDLHYLCMTRYDKTFGLPVIIPPENLHEILAQVMAERGLRNLRVAETEKYAHVTYFFNGGMEAPFAGEERVLVPSPKVATYDLKPEMSAQGIAAKVTEAIENGPFDLIVVNFANADMVGHSGKLAPTVRAVEAVDAGLGEIAAALRRKGGAMLISADHGNAEQMVDPSTGGPHTAHTTNPVPLILVSEERRNWKLRSNGSLRDLAPTILEMLRIPEPPQMTGKSLAEPAAAGPAS